MKRMTRLLQLALPLILFFTYAPDANGQLLKKLGKRAEKAAERTIERRVEKEASEKTDQALDSILEPGKKGDQRKQEIPPETPNDGRNNENSDVSNPGQGDNDPSVSSGSGGPKTISVYSKFDFVPGDKLLFFDDFSNDFIGDFPSKWNTNGSGEVVTINDSEKWFEFKPGSNTFYIPDVPSLPEDYTIEFDVLATGLDRQTTSSAVLRVVLTDDNKFRLGNYAYAGLPFCQYHPVGIKILSPKSEINNTISADIRSVVLDKTHFSVAVNKQRFRLWVNEKKLVDVPRFMPDGIPLTTLKFQLRYFKDGKERLLIKNLKVAEGGVDLRRKLLADGKISTNGILFDSGSANIQPQSMGIIRQIYQVMQQEGSMNLKIVGHTDSDGNDDTNVALSKKRAEAVKDALVSVYSVSSDRLSTEGKGESEPVGDNGTADGKAQNRRVEFIKQ